MADIMDKDSVKKQLKNQFFKRFREILDEKGISQADLGNRIINKYGKNVNSGTLSNAYNGKTLPPLYMIAMIADALECPIGALLGDKVEEVPSKAGESVEEFLHSIFASDKNLLFNPSEKAFAGIWGKYYCYFWPTYSRAEKPHVGEIEFTGFENICKVQFRLHTGEILPGTSEEYVKKYMGVLAIAEPVLTCFCLLKGNEDITTGELCFCAFRCLQLNKQRLDCSIAEVITISAGNAKKVPTAHRMLLSRTKLNEEQLAKVMPSLYMNTSRFIVRDKKLSDYASFTDAEKKMIDKIKRAFPEQKSWFFSEKTLRGFADEDHLSELERNLLINKLRSIADSERYNKASSEANDIVWSIINADKYESD